MVSVIITTFNRRSFLKRAVLSVLNQDYREKEIIVVDDGSEDHSFEEIRGLPIRYEWQANKGVSGARNKGIALSGGEYIAFLDVDDLWIKGKLTRQIKVMEEEGFAVCYTDEVWIRNGKRQNQKERHRKYTGHIFERCLPLCIISPSSVVVRSEVFSDVGPFDESLPVCEDYDMWLRITARYPVRFLDEPLIIKHGGHEDQLSRKYQAMDRFRIQSLTKVIGSGKLDGPMRMAALEELRNKCRIYAQGARKRDRIEEAEQYLRLGAVLLE
jgi:glycosyltransferase involved in cell wall biosynthesis